MLEEALCGKGSPQAGFPYNGVHAALHGPQAGSPASRKRAASPGTVAAAKRPRPPQQQPGLAAGGSATWRHAALAAAATGSTGSAGMPRPQQQPHVQAAAPSLSWPSHPLLEEPLPPSQSPSSGMSPTPARHAGRACEPLTPAALGALRQLDPAAHDLHLRLLRFDDRLAELASRRGLLVRFVLQHSARNAGSGVQQEPLAVEAPEFMTVEYLKRRVARAKLQKGEVLPTARFVLRSNDGGGGPADSSGGASDSGGAPRDLPSSLPNGDEVFLASLGYEAPGPYQLLIATAPQTSDREQQEELLAGLSARAAHGPQPQPGAGAAAARQPVPVRGARLGFRALLEAPAAQEQQEWQRGSRAGGAGGQQAGRAACMARPPAVPPAQPSPPPATEAASNSRAGCGAAGWGVPGKGGASGGDIGQGWAEAEAPPRRQGGRWAPAEVAALVDGVRAFGTSWARIHAAHAQGGAISPHRTQVDLKDKWRNLVKAVARGAEGQSRSGAELTEEQRRVIWNILSATGSGPGA